LAFDGHAEVNLLWAQSGDADPWNLISNLPSSIVVIDPATLRSANDEWFSHWKTAAPKLKVILINDNSQLASQIASRQQDYQGFASLNLQDYASGSLFLEALANRIAAWQLPVTEESQTNSLRLWRTNAAYFPAWTTEHRDAVFLTGQGGMAVLDSAQPSFKWRRSGVRLLGLLLSLFGIAVASRVVYRTSRSDGARDNNEKILTGQNEV
jgi:hypothetical protein